MKSLKTLVSLSALAVCMGAASMANAASISPEGPFTTTAGSIVVQSPSSFGGSVTCGITFSGTVSGGVATITNAALTGGGLCALPTLKSIPSPGWVLTASSATEGKVANVGYTIKKTFIIPGTDCGPSSINVTWNASSHTLTAANQPLSGGCNIVSLTTTASGLTVNP
ncbi:MULTISPECIES: alkane oxidation protein activator PraB [unclassified Pseudomonas]|uniref:alkane oxidation protein activator PraB n=1 Tax=unclassified Pseudomonas TaxID=196821 RepID=UPI0030DB8B5A